MTDIGKGQAFLCILVYIQHKIIGKIGPSLRIFFLGNRIILCLLGHFPEALLPCNLGIGVNLCVFRQILRVQPLQLLLHIQISVKDDIGIGRMIVTRMKSLKSLISQIRNVFGIPAGFVSISSIRKKRMKNITFQHRFRFGKGPSHLIVNHPAVA